jgi:hypothetical protein
MPFFDAAFGFLILSAFEDNHSKEKKFSKVYFFDQ